MARSCRKGVGSLFCGNEKWVSSFTWFDGFINVLCYRVLATQDGIGWLFSAILSGGLIGLGAPFWFKTYRSIVSFVPWTKLSDTLLARQKKTGRMAAGVGGGISPAVSPMVATTASAAPSPVAPAGGVPGAPAPTTPSPVPPGIVTQNDLGLSETDLQDAFKKSERP